MKTLKYFSSVALAASLFSASCIKDDAPALGDRGSSFVKILQAPANNLFFTPFSTVDTFSLVSIRREETSQAANDAPLTLKLVNDTAMLTAYNDSNGTTYEPLPDSLYNFVGTTVTKSGNDFTVTIPGGTIGNEMNIAMDGSKWDISHKYALYLILTDSAGHRIRTGQSETLVTIEAKNKYDGYYSLRIKTTGWTDYGIADGDVGDFPGLVGMLTVGPDKSDMYTTNFSSYLQPAFTTALAAATQFGATTPRFIFNLESDALVDVINTTPDDGRSRALRLNPDVTDSRYDASSKTIYAAYIMSQTGRPDQYIYDTLVYKQSR